MKNLLAKNEGTFDRLIRVIIGVAVLSLTVVGPRTAWGYLGLIPILTGLIGTCPLYSLLGLNTCGVKKQTIATHN